jgi:hypothetical protein
MMIVAAREFNTIFRLSLVGPAFNKKKIQGKISSLGISNASKKADVVVKIDIPLNPNKNVLELLQFYMLVRLFGLFFGRALNPEEL